MAMIAERENLRRYFEPMHLDITDLIFVTNVYGMKISLQFKHENCEW